MPPNPRVCDLRLRWLKGGGAVGEWCRSPQRHPLIVSINFLFTLFTSCLLSMHVGCLLAMSFLRRKHTLCVTTMLVRVVTLSALPQDFLPECFRGIATESSCLSSCAGTVSLGDFGPVCYTRVDESSKTITA